MTQDETIEQQARREAEAAYHSSGNEMSDHKKRQCFVTGWLACAERSKPQPSVDEVVAFIERAVKVMERTANDTLDGRNAAIDGRELLTKMFTEKTDTLGA